MSHERLHVVVIDDVVDNLDVVCAMLEDEFNVSAFTSCRQAMTGVLYTRANVLLMDIAMTEIDGLQCLTQLRLIPEFKDTPAIAITALAYPEDKERCLAAGFQAVVVKPVLDQEELRRLIRSLSETIPGV